MINTSLERCVSFINSQTVSATRTADVSLRRAVTISRQAGCGAVQVAGVLANYLQKHLPPPSGVSWTVFDRNLMEKVMEDHYLPASLARLLAEDHVSEFEDALAEIFHMRPNTRTIVRQSAETMLQLANCGSVILIGRAGHIITASLPHVLHVRLVAPLEDRVERICRADNKSPAEAREFCIHEEAARARYVKTYFKMDINDPLQYHLVINTSRVGCENAGRLIGDTVLRMKV